MAGPIPAWFANILRHRVEKRQRMRLRRAILHHNNLAELRCACNPAATFAKKASPVAHYTGVKKKP